MGQQVKAIVYGVFLDTDNPEHNRLVDNDPVFPRHLGRVEMGIGMMVIGFAVAVDCVADEHAGEADMPDCRVMDVGIVLEPQIEAAKDKWFSLEEWWRGQGGKTFGVPDVLLVTVERA